MPRVGCDLKSCVICDTLYINGRELTCSDGCHEKLVDILIARFGEFKKVVRMRTGVAYKVPTRDIIEKGIREQDLDRYPLWEEGKKTTRNETTNLIASFLPILEVD